MGTTANLTSLDPVVKTLYPQKDITKFFYDNAPFLAMVPKGTDFGGKVAQLAMRFATTGGRSQDIATAINTKAAAAYAKFILTRAHDYSLFNIDGETIRAAMGDKNAIVEGLAGEIDAAMDALKRAIQIDMYRNGGGARGFGDGVYSVAGATVQLGRPQDIVNFEVNMTVNFAATDGTSGSPRVGSLLITNVNRDTGAFTCSTNVTASIAAAVNTDFIFQMGDFLAAAGQLKLMGLDGWIPATPPTSTPFFGLDRSQDVYRLGGIRTAGAGLAIEEALQKLGTRIAREGGKPSHGFLNNDDFLNLALSLGSRLSYFDEKTDVGVGFMGLTIIAGGQKIKMFADPNCQISTGWILQMDKWKLWSLGEMPGFLGGGADGLRLLRSTSSDSYEGRLGYYANLYTTAPGYSGRTTL